MFADGTAVTQLIAEGSPEEVGPVLYAQLSVGAAMIASGFALETFFEVEEPKEPGAEPGTIDIYRDSPLRFLGYANEVGEAFRPLVPVELVYFSYFAAISYILADTVDKGRKGAAVGGGSAALRGTLGALDTFSWQMLASVLFPSYIINRSVCYLDGMQGLGALPELLQASWLPTVVGLILIPLIILPLDVLAHFTMNSSFRRAANTVLPADAK